MMFRRVFFLALVLSTMLAMPAFAAVENVKISGDITTRGLYRDHLGLGGVGDNNSFNGVIFNPNDEDQKFYMSQVRLRFDADLSQHISSELELLNQRDWDAPHGGTQGSALSTNTLVGPGAATGVSAGNDQFDVILNLANITIKELYYPELSVRVGRQKVQWGEGFVIGSSQLGNPDPSGTMTADEFSLSNGIDAIRTMIDKAPWHFDLLLAKLHEGSTTDGDDETLYGINVGRTFESFKSEGEIYFIGKRDSGRTNSVGDVFSETEDIWAWGTRGSIHPWDRLKLSGETVFEYGEEGGAGVPGTGLSHFTLNGARKQDIHAWAFDLRAEWNWLEAVWPTTLGTEWVYYSGEEKSEGAKSSSYRPLLRGKFHSFLREFHGHFYQTDVGITPGYTNQHQLMFDLLLHPFNRKDLTFFARWLLLWLDEVPIEGRGDFIGNELDMKLAYDYTEDLKFSFGSAFLFPGSYFNTPALTQNVAGQTVDQAGRTAKELMAEVALMF